MSTGELYVKGARVWIPDQENVWQCAEITDYSKTSLAVIYEESGISKEFQIKGDEDLPPLRNPDILIGENDLTSLSYLHEPAVLYNLKVRFCNQNVIYTYCGIVLVAINPYNELAIYGSDTIAAYRGQAMGDLDPHIFAVAEEAFTKMERENRDQSIIVSGESGAGKTVSAKYTMRYFASVGGSFDETQVEKKILASNPIMEAIGNAKTTRNDNSSRFGKYIELDFNKNFHIMGANMRTYLLEKSRVVFQAPDERNYHIFYQLCSVSSDSKWSHLMLGDQDNFHYLNQGDNPTIEGVDDAADFLETCKAFSLLGISESKQDQIFRILAAVLHLGNVELIEGNADSCVIENTDQFLQCATKLLGINGDDLKMWLCNRKITSGREVFTKPVTVDEATFARDALSKHIYSQLFEWIVHEINKCFACSSKPFRFIGVLDIYGFETFQINSFEQFCINYANEKLQQQFNQHVFKLEQEEYVKEKIEWEFINFYDNQPCIDLIESKLGILDLLDEECKMPKGTDLSWVEKLYVRCTKWDHFSKPRLSNTSFLIKHFADTVAYESAGFLEKNRDTVSEECLNVLQSSQISLVKELFSEKKQQMAAQKKIKVMPTAPSKNKQMKKSVGSQFRESLSLLMVTLNSTTPHYVRCIKPNDEKLSFSFDPVRAIQQLRACGVLETVRISAAGYPSRWTYLDFFQRYRVLCRSKDVKREDLKITCEKIIANMIHDEDKFKFGRTKIFFRAGQVAYMEKLRADRLRACGIMIQKHVKGFLHRRKYTKIRASTLILQKYARGFIARSQVRHMRKEAAAIRIQACVRGWIKYVCYKRLRYIIIRIQAYARGRMARENYMHLCQLKAALIIQKNVRKWIAVQKYRRITRGIVAIQGRVRVFLARKQLRKLKIEAKSVEHQRKLNKGLENKIISMQQKITEYKLMVSQLPELKEEIVTLKLQVADMKTIENKLKINDNKIIDFEDQINLLTKQLEVERAEKMDILTEKEKNDKENQEIIAKLNAENIRVSTLLNKATDETVLLEGEEKLRQKFATEKQLLLLEYQEDKASYQNILKEYHKLELKCEKLERDLQFAHGNAHKRSASNLSNVSGLSDATTEIAWDEASDAYSVATDEDRGYGSVRSRLSNNGLDRERRLDNVEWEREGEVSLQVPVKPVEDVSLVLKLQHQVRDLNKDREGLRKRVEILEAASPTDDPQHAQEMIRLQELEMENAKLKDDLRRIRKSIADSEPHDAKVQEYIKQFESLQDELERRREECIQLRTVLANRTTDMRSLTQSSYGKDVDIVNEDGEVVMALQAQKQINKQLVDEMKSQKQKFKKNEAEYKSELTRLKQDNERQQDLIGKAISDNSSSVGPSEALLQSEVMRLTSENLDLQGQMNDLNEQLKKYKRTLKVYSKKLKDTGAGEPAEIEAEEIEKSMMPVIRKKEREYIGMLEYDRKDETKIIRVLIYELKPRVAVTLLPGLPAYILFMCIRHTDHINDDEKVRSLLNNIVNGIKRVIKKRHEDLDSTVLWLSNTLRLLHNLKQYSDEKAYQTENTDKQNEQFLKNFDLSEYRQVLSEMGVWIYNAVIKLMEQKVQPLIVSAVLEHEAIAGLSGNKPSGMRGRASSTAKEVDTPVEPQKALDELMKELTQFYRTLALFGTDPEILTQVFRQIFYFICAGALNNLLLRKDICHWSKGMQIRYNLSHLEQWTRDMKLQESGVTDTLAPIIQAAQLLQARKTDEDVNSICEMCDSLNRSQIIKILNCYTPADDYEERVPISFINKIQARLKERSDQDQSQNLLMDTKYAFPVRFPFNPSSIRLEDIELPECLNINFLKKI